VRAPAAQPRLLRFRGDGDSTATVERPADEAIATEQPPRALPMRWVLLACLAVSALTLLLPSVPTYDPWAWLLWGRQIVELDLVTTGGPSWKPLPMLFIVPFQAIGEVIGSDQFAPYAWLWIARAGGLLACVMAFRLARRIVGGGAAGMFAGLVAFASLFSSFKFVRDSALGNSEPLMAALVLWAVERHLDGRRDHAFYLGAGAGLMRPEVWPFLGLYGLWLWFRDPHLRLRMAALAVALPVLWFVPEQWGSGDWFRAANRANDPRPSSPAFADFPAGEILSRYKSTVVEPIVVAGLFATLVAGLRYFRRLGPTSERRRDWTTLVIAGGGAAWLALVAGMTQAGYAGNQRYLIIPTAALSVLAGVGVIRIPQGIAWLARRRFDARVARGIALAAAAIFAVATAPVIAKKVDQIETISNSLEYEANGWEDLQAAIDEAGGEQALIACRGLFSGAFQTQMIAYELHLVGLRIGWAGDAPPAKPAIPPAAVFRTRTDPALARVPAITEPGYREVARVRAFTILTNPTGAPGCPRGSGPAHEPAQYHFQRQAR
jgi:hypothetical protein